MPSRGEGWLTSYREKAGPGDVLRGDEGRGARWWRTLLEGFTHVGDGSLGQLQDRIGRQVKELGTAFRLPGEADERAWPLSAVPLLIGEDEWRGIEAGICQRAELLELILADVFGEQKLVRDGALPAALVTGSRHFWRSMIGVPPPGGRRLHIYAADLARGPDGEWRVLADHARTPAGAGYALENRLAASRVMGTLQTRLNVERLAPFFSAFRAGLAAVCHRDDPRIALLTPGRYNQSYAEQAHLARYLGLLLVEGGDLAVRDNQLFVRTVEGLKRVDALWRRMDTRFIDPLAFDSRSAIGVPGLMDAVLAGNTVIANAAGAGVVESTGMSAFLPNLARRLTGTMLRLPNIATWWCGQPRERAHVEANMADLLIAPAFGDRPAGLADGRAVLGSRLDGPARAALLAGLARRPQDYVGQEVVRLSTMPAAAGDKLVARPFTLRVFAARDGAGDWTVMPGGFARLGEDADSRAAVMGEGAFSADVCVVGRAPVESVSLLPANVAIRRNPGTLPSRAADNLFWLGRYLERGEATLRLVRAALGGTIDSVGGAALVPATVARLTGLLISSGAAGGGGKEEEEEARRADVRTLATAALDGTGGASVRSLLGSVHAIAEGTRDRLSADVWRLIDAAPPAAQDEDASGLLGRATALLERFSALAGLAAENMGRTAGWRFHDLGRRIERAAIVCRQLRAFAGDDAGADDLTTLLDLNDSQISYRARYMTGLALAPVRDLIALDPFNPRALAFQVERIRAHLDALPRLKDDGMAEEPQRLATEIDALVSMQRAESLGTHAVMAVENRLYALSDAIGRRFFLQDNETLRAAGMTLA
ncbi:circularly permuted type 2 ATP-grasp protein [Sphingomonas profundi]|uniref:circularly permuted type 2 ATP-grasp protein n=1 Tax=Alterirhizorhabdus profundi TaxID=2681549 RepID=UPI0012E8BBF3|nr:circularly permuted type 2 ATP-grasp protein [Sphingomonas profundi]